MAGVSKHLKKGVIKLLPAAQLVTNALDNMKRQINGQSEVFSHLCLEVASKLANFSQLAWVLDCCCKVRELGSILLLAQSGHCPEHTHRSNTA
jgi:hypothetical protein